VPDWDAVGSALAADGDKAKSEARANGARARVDRSALSRDADIVRLVQREVAQLTAQLHDYERVRRVALLAEEFSIDGGEMTPTLKVKRRVVDEKFGALIEELYEGASAKESWP
jgi:long-chain acyl-CoA synthetase